MRTTRYHDDDAVPSRALFNRVYKRQLADAHDINCGRCRPHRGENATSVSTGSNPRKQGRVRRGGVRD